ncbi:MAG: hypothetical protein AB1750_11680 [Chloroflexota bacterium]
MNETYLESQTVSLPPAPKKGPGVASILTVVLGLFTIVLLCGMAGLGYWAYTLNRDLKTTQTDRDQWKAKYDTATNEKNKLTTDLNSTKSELDATKAELEAAKAELETTEADLESARNDLAALQADVDTALKYLNVFDGFWGDTFDESETKIKATGDSDLLATYRVFKNSRLLEDFYPFFDQLVATVIDLLR